jgi:hypothetical protein
MRFRLDYLSKIKIPTRSSPQVYEDLKAGKKFIAVEQDFDEWSLPNGYLVITTDYDGQAFRAVVPTSTAVWIANRGETPGGTDLDEILDDLAEATNDVREFERELISEGDINTQETNWKMQLVGAYETYLVNKITKPHGNDVRFDHKALDELGLTNSEVEKRLKAIAAICKGISPEEVQVSDDLSSVLYHETRIDYEEEITQSYTVSCDCGSHIEYQTAYRKVLQKHSMKANLYHPQIDQLKSKINDLRKDLPKGRHDDNLINLYINLRYMKEEPDKWLPISGK